jgi:hypothetical protein
MMSVLADLPSKAARTVQDIVAETSPTDRMPLVIDAAETGVTDQTAEDVTVALLPSRYCAKHWKFAVLFSETSEGPSIVSDTKVGSFGVLSFPGGRSVHFFGMVSVLFRGSE